jgi:drug/metabolite transporter (DMT)-like permease
LYPQLLAILVGSREFDKWMNLPVSNHNWLLFLAIGVIGGTVGYLAWWMSVGGKKRGTWLKDFLRKEER